MEVEVKFKISDPEKIEKILSKKAEFVIEKIEHDYYFNHPCRDFRETDEALRLRKDVEGITLTYKGKRIDQETKTREEFKVKLNDFEETRKILERLGFKKAGEVIKRRKIYRDGDLLICLDHLENIGDFVELEIESENVEEAKKRIFGYAELLGLEREKSIRKSYLEMVLDVADNNGKGQHS